MWLSIEKCDVILDSYDSLNRDGSEIIHKERKCFRIEETVYITGYGNQCGEDAILILYTLLADPQ